MPPEQTAVKTLAHLNSRWDDRRSIVAGRIVLRAAELVLHSLRLRRLWKTATPIEARGSLRSLLAAASQGRPIELCTTRELDRPSVIGFLAPRILIPEWLFSRLTPGELEQVVLHESEHLRRRDDWTNLLQKFFLVLFPLNPALAWIERRLCREREMACDEGVVRRTQAPRAYAACLTTLAERETEQRELLQRTQVLSLGAFEHRPELVHRVHTILWRRQALHPAAARALVGAVGCGLLFGSVELARCPQVVAFVAAQRPSVQAAEPMPATAEPTGLERAAYEPASESIRAHVAGLRAIPAKAILSARHGAAEPVAFASPRRSAKPSANATESAIVAMVPGAPRERLVKAFAPTPAPAQSAEYFIFATWERVQTSPSRAEAIADYDTSATKESQAGAVMKQPETQAAVRIIVTRVILAVYPAGSAPHPSAPSASTARTTGSHSNRPAEPLVENGWLFFQL